jgi:hypothetical protein
MKLTMVLMAALLLVGAVLGSTALNAVGNAGAALAQSGQGERKTPDVIQLANESKLGIVSFSHANHVTKNYNVAGTGPVACVECHHTAQPASEVAKTPPLQTAWPKDRTVTLTAETFKDPRHPKS